MKDQKIQFQETALEGPRTTVAIVRCDSYRQPQTMQAVKRAVDLIGGIGDLIPPGQSVLVKPNLLKAGPPDAAVTTHPEILRSVIRLLHESGAKVWVGDSPGIGDLGRVAERAGVLSVVREEGASIVDFGDPVPIRNKGRFQHFEIARPAIVADAIINLPKFKTHGMTVLTGAVKNLFGCIPGKRKVQWHFNTGVDHDAFALMLVELAALLRPRLTIMDAVVGMEGNGPGNGDPRHMGIILVGTDPVAVDVVAGAVVGLDPDQLPIVEAARKAGIGVAGLDRIAVVGEVLSKIAISDFRLPPQAHAEWPLPEWLRRRLKDALTTRPLIDHRICIRCGICRSDCPQQAITESREGICIDHRRCIRCFCCQEFCPQGAVSIGRGWLLQLLQR
jgi:uncharacterized protein (DUF362 family)/Pyruvate/2-oxoacid:ferredoxin oxidoreductase delta subunit